MTPWQATPGAGASVEVHPLFPLSLGPPSSDPALPSPLKPPMTVPPRYLELLLLMQVLAGSVLGAFQLPLQLSQVWLGGTVILKCLYTRCSNTAVHICKGVAEASCSDSAV